MEEETQTSTQKEAPGTQGPKQGWTTVSVLLIFIYSIYLNLIWFKFDKLFYDFRQLLQVCLHKVIRSLLCGCLSRLPEKVRGSVIPCIKTFKLIHYWKFSVRFLSLSKTSKGLLVSMAILHQIPWWCTAKEQRQHKRRAKASAQQ